MGIPTVSCVAAAKYWHETHLLRPTADCAHVRLCMGVEEKSFFQKRE